MLKKFCGWRAGVEISSSLMSVKQTEVRYVRWADEPVETVNPLFDRQYIVGDRVMVARIVMKKGCVVPEHSHHNEQVTQVVSGSLRFSINGGEIIVSAGDFLFIPPHVPHAAVALEDAISFDTFTPPREDWINKTDLYLRR
jgi:quercetin dioxygenase-like cupin family protein